MSAISYCKLDLGVKDEFLMQCVQEFNNNAFYNGVIVPLFFMFIFAIIITIFAIGVGWVSKREREEMNSPIEEPERIILNSH